MCEFKRPRRHLEVMPSQHDQTVSTDNIESYHHDPGRTGNDPSMDDRNPRLEINLNESTCRDRAARTNASVDHDDADGGESAEVPKPRIWPETYTSIVLLCLLLAVGLLVMCIPFLPSRKDLGYSFVNKFVIIRNVVLAIFIALVLVVMAWLTRKVVELHDKGLVLWPQRCKHCAFALMQIKLYEKAVEKRQTFHLDEMREIPGEDIKTEQASTVSKVTINIVYIFSGLGLIFIVTSIVDICLCFNEHSPVSPTNATNAELITVFIVHVCLFAVVYYLSFHLIPNYYDAFMVAVPRIHWSFVLLIGVGIWISIERFVKPFAFVSYSKYRKHYLCSVNSSAGEFVQGISDIAHPFSIELPLMVTWMFIEMWSRFLPRHAHDIMKNINKENKINSFVQNGIVQSSNWGNVGRIFSSSLRTKRRKSNEYDCILLQRHPNFGALDHHDHSDGIMIPESIEMLPVGSLNGFSHTRSRKPTDLSSGQNTGTRDLKRALSNEMEKAIAVTLLICVVYFGLSNLLLARDSKLRGRYLQWFLRMAFFTPMIMLILRHRKLTREADGSNAVRSESASSQESNKMLLITLTGAFLYETSCLLSSIGNLCNVTGLSHDEITLNIVSIFASLFGVVRIYHQSIFLLCVQRQQPRNDNERKWTLLCLLVVGMANATQWMFDSLVHEPGSSVAWPVLHMFFAGNIGLVLGMLFAPFDHLYELHAAIITYEIYKVIWSL